MDEEYKMRKEKIQVSVIVPTYNRILKLFRLLKSLDKLNPIQDEIVIIDDNSLIIGSYYKDDEIRHLLTASTPYFLTLHDSFQYTNPVEEQFEDRMIVQRFGKNFIFKQITLKKESSPYYLLLLKEDPVFHKEDLESFAYLLKEILYK